MTDRAKELIARVRELDKAATLGPWIADGSGFETLHPDHQKIDNGSGWREPSNAVGHCSDGEYVENGNAENDAAFIAFSRTALPDLATLAEQAIAQNDNYHNAVNVLHDRLAAEQARAEKAEADLAEARRMLKEADNQIAWDHAARGVTVKFPGTHIALEATARHQAREGR